MKNLPAFLFCCLFYLPDAWSIHQYKTGDTLYVWAYHGLTLRSGPSTKADKKVVIAYGERVVTLDSLKVKTQSVEEFPGFALRGYWSKIRYGSIEGWVFDGYLSHYPAINKMNLAAVRQPWQEVYLPYGKAAFGPANHRRLELETNKHTLDSLSSRDQYAYKNGVVFEYCRFRGDGGGGFVNYVFPDLSFEECYLFFFYNTSYFLWDAKFPSKESLGRVPTNDLPFVSLKDKNHLTIRWSTCEYIFEKKGRKTYIQIFCSC